MYTYYLLAVVCCLAFIPDVYSQTTRDALEEERRAVLEKIEGTNQVLEQTRKTRMSELGELRSLLKQIDQRQQLISHLSKELSYIVNSISQTNDIVVALNRDLDELRKEYAAMVYMASKNRAGSSYQKLSYLFASESINQLLNRAQYLSQYQATRQYQMEQIRQVTAMLEEKKIALERQQGERYELLAQERSQQMELEQMRRKQAELVKELGKQETGLMAGLRSEQQVLDQIAQLLTPVVAEASLENATASIAGGVESANRRALFEYNQSNLPWPVENGFISSKFGKQQHPVFEHVWTENIGIEITTAENAAVKSVFEGSVSAVKQLPGRQYVVMIQHGKYYTVYARLKHVSVKVGEQISRGFTLGTVGLNPEGVPSLQFQVWKNQQKLDPEQWLLQ